MLDIVTKRTIQYKTVKTSKNTDITHSMTRHIKVFMGKVEFFLKILTKFADQAIWASSFYYVDQTIIA